MIWLRSQLFQRSRLNDSYYRVSLIFYLSDRCQAIRRCCIFLAHRPHMAAILNLESLRYMLPLASHQLSLCPPAVPAKACTLWGVCLVFGFFSTLKLVSTFQRNIQDGGLCRLGSVGVECWKRRWASHFERLSEFAGWQRASESWKPQLILI